MSNKRKKKKPKVSRSVIKKATKGLSSLDMYIANNPAHHYVVEFRRENTDHVLGFAVAMNSEEVKAHIGKITSQINGRLDISTLPRDAEDYAVDIGRLEAGYVQHNRINGSH